MPIEMTSPVGGPLQLLDELVAEGRGEFTFGEARARLGASSTATANALRRLSDKGLVDRVVRGRYAIRPLGSLGTSAAAEDLGLAVGAAFVGREHRIAYLTALGELGALSHPVPPVFVACTEQVRRQAISRRPLRVVIERPKTIHLEAEPTGHSWTSTLQRALFECALRVDLCGGVERLAEALVGSVGQVDAGRIVPLVRAFGARGRAAERRLASLADALDLFLGLKPEVDRRRPVIRLDPRDRHVDWIDERYRVAWNMTPDELRAVVSN
jgi:predicted transcriptional regulator of viral defense system